MSQAQVREWALVLDAEGIPYDIAPTAEGNWTLVVAPGDAERTAVALSAYRTENAADLLAVREPPTAATRGGKYVGLAAAGLLVAFFAVTGPRDGGSYWFGAGAADADAIRSGEVWRAATALTLHADFEHVLANALSGALFVGLVADVLGPGVGLVLIVLAGAGGNLINVWLRGGEYSGVGASTAVFGAVGILAGAQFARYRRPGMPAGRGWMAVLAGLGLLILLGMNPQTDVLAHVFGFLAGLALGTLARLGPPRPAGPAAQWALVALALAAVAGCWVAAIG